MQAKCMYITVRVLKYVCVSICMFVYSMYLCKKSIHVGYVCIYKLVCRCLCIVYISMLVCMHVCVYVTHCSRSCNNIILFSFYFVFF